MHRVSLLRRCRSAWLGLVVLLVAVGAHAREAQVMHVTHDVAFDVLPALARLETLFGRVVTPLTLERLRVRAAASAQAIEGDSIDLSGQRFSLYVPNGAAPVGGYGLLVFVPPWDEASIPSSWLPVLARHGFIAVTAAQSGNDADVVAQRMPLALAGYANVSKRYPLDPARVYVGGFSGGARVAQRIALAYPEVFSGALINAGSDAFGNDGAAVPDASLWRRFEDHSRLVYATGSRDDSALASDRRSRASARGLCMRDIVTVPMRGRGHEPVDAATLDRAITALRAPRKVNADIDACRAGRAAEIARQLGAVRQRIEDGDLRGAGRQLDAVDARFGGLALPASLELARRLAAADAAAVKS